jgi:hypothetical protein
MSAAMSSPDSYFDDRAKHIQSVVAPSGPKRLVFLTYIGRGRSGTLLVCQKDQRATRQIQLVLGCDLNFEHPFVFTLGFVQVWAKSHKGKYKQFGEDAWPFCTRDGDNEWVVGCTAFWTCPPTDPGSMKLFKELLE